MQLGKRSALWDHTAALIVHIRLSAGDKHAAMEKYHPYLNIEQGDKRQAFKQLIGKKKNG